MSDANEDALFAVCPNIEKVDELNILAESDEAGVYIVGTKDGRHIFITGHSEYDPLTLKSEYDRDVNKGLPIQIPQNLDERIDLMRGRS